MFWRTAFELRCKRVLPLPVLRLALPMWSANGCVGMTAWRLEWRRRPAQASGRARAKTRSSPWSASAWPTTCGRAELRPPSLPLSTRTILISKSLLPSVAARRIRRLARPTAARSSAGMQSRGFSAGVRNSAREEMPPSDKPRASICSSWTTTLCCFLRPRFRCSRRLRSEWTPTFSTSAVSFFIGPSEGSLDQRMEHSRRPFLGGDVATGAFVNCFGSSNALVRREAFEALGGFSDEAESTLDDWELFSKAALAGLRIETMPEVFVWYREDPDSENLVHSLVNAVRSVSWYTKPGHKDGSRSRTRSSPGDAVRRGFEIRTGRAHRHAALPRRTRSCSHRMRSSATRGEFQSLKGAHGRRC